MKTIKLATTIILLIITIYITQLKPTPQHNKNTESYNNKITKNQNENSKTNEKIITNGISQNRVNKNTYQKNGITYIEPNNEFLNGGLAQNYTQLKSEADNGNAQSAYLLGVNLQKCLTAPLDADETNTAIEHSRAVLPPGSEGYNEFVSASEQTIMKDYYYCEGISIDQRNEFFHYIKLAIAGGSIYAASSHIAYDQLVDRLHKNLSVEEKAKIINDYALEHRIVMKNSSEHGSIPAIIRLAQSYNDEHSILKNNSAMVESLKYYLVLKDYAENEHQPYIQKRIQLQTDFLTPQEVSLAEEEAEKLKLKIEKNKTIYKMNKSIY